MFPVPFATSLWWMCGGHVTLGSLIATFVAAFFYTKHNSKLMSVLIYLGVALLCWIIGDWVFGPFSLTSTTENPRF